MRCCTAWLLEPSSFAVLGHLKRVPFPWTYFCFEGAVPSHAHCDLVRLPAVVQIGPSSQPLKEVLGRRRRRDDQPSRDSPAYLEYARWPHTQLSLSPCPGPMPFPFSGSRGLQPLLFFSLSDAPMPSPWHSPRLPCVQGRPQPPHGAPWRVAWRLAAGTARLAACGDETIFGDAGVCGLQARTERGPERPRRHQEQRRRSASGPATHRRRSGGPRTLVGAHRAVCRRCFVLSVLMML